MSESNATPITSECFTPWQEALAHLQHTAFLWEPKPTRAPHRDSTLWVSYFTICGSAEESAARLRLVCEAFSLLNLLARVNIDLWKSTLRTLWPDFAKVEWFDLEETLLDIPVLGLGCRDDVADVTVMLQQADQVKTASPHYHSLRKRLEAAIEGIPEVTSVPFRVELHCYWRDPLIIKGMLENTVQLANYAGSRSQSPRGTRMRRMPSFHLAEVYFMSTSCVAIDIDGLQLLRKIADCGVSMNVLPSLRSFDWRSLRHGGIPKVISSPADIVGMLRALLLHAADQNSRVRKAVVADHFLPHLVPGILSAVQDSQTIDTVEINLGDDWNDVEREDWISRPPRGSDRQQEWAQIAYALFSQHASHNIETLELKVNKLQIQEVEAVRRILEAKNPLAVLDNRPDIVVVNHPTRISASNFRLEDPDRPNPQALAVMSRNRDVERKLSFSTPDPQHVRVIQAPDSNDPFKYWTVWLPGHGKAWVHSNDVQSSDFPADLPVSQHERPSFPRIDVVEMSPSSADAIMDLLEIIGHDTKHVHLAALYIEPPLIDGCCRHVLRVCPRLEHLDLGGASLGSLGLFVESAEAGHCRLRELHRIGVLTKDTDNVIPFLRALANPTHALTKHLEFLDIRFEMEAATTDRVIQALGDMLRLNDRLYKVRCRFQTADQAEAEHVQQQIDAVDPTGAYIRRAPFEIRKKLAFLSVVSNAITETNGSGRGHAVNRVDTNVIELVFQFAANGCERDVWMSFTYDEPAFEPDNDDPDDDADMESEEPDDA